LTFQPVCLTPPGGIMDGIDDPVEKRWLA
jgi:hypothetical protein